MTARKPRPPTPADFDVPYLPWFSAPALENNWPPGWLPNDDWHSTQAVSAASTASRQRQVELGNTGSIDGLSTASAEMILRYRAAAQRAIEPAKAGQP